MWPPLTMRATYGRLRWAVFEEVGPVVTLEVVHPDQVGSGRQRDGLRTGQTHEQRSSEPWPRRDGHRVDLTEPDVGLRERLLEQGVERFHVSPCRDLGHDTPEPFMQRHLRGDQVGAHGVAVVDDGDSGLVAGSLDAERDHEVDTRPAMEFAIVRIRFA